MENNRKTGDIFESAAVMYLQNKNYKILETKFRSPTGEIDIIAKFEEYVIFIEVKYRKNVLLGHPREAVNLRKQKVIRKVALFYIVKNNLVNTDFRFDVIEIIGGEKITLTHIENAF